MRLNDEVLEIDHALASAEAFERLAYCRVVELQRLYSIFSNSFFERMGSHDRESLHYWLKDAENEATEAHTRAERVVRLLKLAARDRPERRDEPSVEPGTTLQ